MTPARLLLGLVATFAVAGLLALTLRSKMNLPPEPPPDMRPDPVPVAETPPKEVVGEGAAPVEHPDPVVEENPTEAARRAEEREATLQRMSGIGRKWLDDVTVQFALSDSQSREIWKITEDFMKSYEAVRARGLSGEEHKRAMGAVYGRANAAIRDILGPKGKAPWRGLPADWGSGDPPAGR